MAKGQVTDDELASGLKNFGGFGSLGGQKPRREDPFRDTRVEAPPAAPTRAESPRIEIVKIDEPAREARKVTSNVVSPVESTPIKSKDKQPPRIAVAKAERAAKLAKPIPVTASPGERKSELYAERVTVPLDAELRDGAESLAKELQRNRTEKGERITANTVMRVALRAMLDRFKVRDAEVVNTEQELYESLCEQLSGK